MFIRLTLHAELGMHNKEEVSRVRRCAGLRLFKGGAQGRQQMAAAGSAPVIL